MSLHIAQMDKQPSEEVEAAELETPQIEKRGEELSTEEQNGEAITPRGDLKTAESSKGQVQKSRVFTLRGLRARPMASPMSSDISSGTGSEKRKSKAVTADSTPPSETGETTVIAKPATRISSSTSVSRSTGQYAAQAAAEVKRMLDEGVGIEEANVLRIKMARLQAFMDNQKYKPHHRTAKKYEEIIEEAQKCLRPKTTSRTADLATTRNSKPQFDSNQFFAQMQEAQAELRAAMKQSSEASESAAKVLSQASSEAKKVEAAVKQATVAAVEAVSAAAAHEKEKLGAGAQTVASPPHVENVDDSFDLCPQWSSQTPRIFKLKTR